MRRLGSAPEFNGFGLQSLGFVVQGFGGLSAIGFQVLGFKDLGF